MNEMITFFKRYPQFVKQAESLQDASFYNEESFAFVVALKFLLHPQMIVIVKENLLAAQQFYNHLYPLLKEDCQLYAVDEVTKFTSLATSPEMEATRLYILAQSCQKKPMVVITHTMALQRLTPKKSLFLQQILHFKVGDKQSKKNIMQQLVKLGYQSVLQVTQSFEFSSRGGVIDIFSIQYAFPVRIEFFDDEVESIRFFDPQTQRTTSVIQSCEIMPATEFLIDDITFQQGIQKIEEVLQQQKQHCALNLTLEERVNEDITKLINYQWDESLFKYYGYFENHEPLTSYFEEALFYICNENQIKENSQFFENEIEETTMEMFEKGQSLHSLFMFYSLSEILSAIKNLYHIEIGLQTTIQPLIAFLKVDCFDFNYHVLETAFQDWLEENKTIYIGLENAIHYDSLKSYLLEKQYTFQEIETLPFSLKKGIYLSHHDFHLGLDFDVFSLVVLGENEIFKRQYRTRGHFSRFKNAVTIDRIEDLKEGDYVVHEHHGIGIYRGIITLETNGIHKDYLKIEYKNKDVVYIALEQFKLIRKYVSKEGVVPKIHKLGSKEWEKTKSKVKERIKDIAEKLIQLYSLRSQKAGFAFSKDDFLSQSFEQDFGYELTFDQKKALQEIKEDMEKPIIMDRLLCGDVGFGKTEVAFRAIFKAINSGKQVALLCPTTLLARQHYLTAVERFKNYGVRIALLSRMVSEKEQQSILKRLKEKEIDLIIGTHRLLSNDVAFADLGFLVVDEEHKFGVEHKEKIKELKASIDVLTLSATPIPRTLQMALTGVRGFSTITTPIENRMPVQTYVLEKNDYVIKEIIERELARGGQVYYLHNRIEELPKIALKLKKSIRNAKIAIVHGQLPSDEMEDIMETFIRGETNILCCTTVIENGIDIPNVNTIIVENADCFGLSQLYQIRGRVGRSDRLAYAYLFYKSQKNLSELAQKRLTTIKEFTQLGSGYKVAMRDLITRGAGDLLGAEQSGFIESVGMDMYIDLLHEAIEEQKNGVLSPKKEAKPKTTLQIDAYIPQGFFNNDYEKIELYRQIDQVEQLENLNQLKEEIIDKTGKLPESIRLLFEKKVIDIIEQEGIIENYRETDQELVLKLSETFSSYRGVGLDLFELANQISTAIVLKFPHMRIEVHVKKIDQWLYLVSDFVKGLVKIQKKYQRGN